eukprot:10939828-Prorocentrum_lima.AAC.1
MFGGCVPAHALYFSIFEQIRSQVEPSLRPLDATGSIAEAFALGWAIIDGGDGRCGSGGDLRARS